MGGKRAERGGWEEEVEGVDEFESGFGEVDGSDMARGWEKVL